jgi:hypothetical protein
MDVALRAIKRLLNGRSAAVEWLLYFTPFLLRCAIYFVLSERHFDLKA